MKKILTVIVSVIFLLCGCAAEKPKSQSEPVNAVYVKAVWISYYELETMLSDCKTESDFEKKVKSAFREIRSDGLNTVTVQVRPCADAFYKSEYFPVSKYCFGTQGGELKFDPLQIMIDAARQLGLRIEAWVNPYRVSQDADVDALSDSNIAKQWLNDDNKKSNVYIDDKIYFNPASQEVKELIVNGVKEIVSKYAVDAVHFDDYFYPTTDEEIDEKEFSQYKESGGDMSLSDWRRENVSDMVKSVYNAVKEINSSVEFGISPQSKLSADYNTLYADVERWVTEEGFVDYICPQIYFGFYNEVQPFTRTVKDWEDMVKSCKLYVGLALYKSGQKDEFASTDQSYAINEFIDSHDIISRQISYLYQINGVKGFYLFSYSYLTDKENTSATEEVKAIKKVIQQSSIQH